MKLLFGHLMFIAGGLLAAIGTGFLTEAADEWRMSAVDRRRLAEAATAGILMVPSGLLLLWLSL